MELPDNLFTDPTAEITFTAPEKGLLTSVWFGDETFTFDPPIPVEKGKSMPIPLKKNDDGTWSKA